ncbi:hypothetical protein RHMOL_Rhmol12G0102600 [Rhododendron molle]|uniref:Uncharacterized protein n=1 Tax=Rhododendron molle TaxID=49168 RepID=A0ACC0LI06_RHOML|nr:hypothetical protein RHMOL_Rhmol12G0102600 [Rhododendron molle]
MKRGQVESREWLQNRLLHPLGEEVTKSAPGCNLKANPHIDSKVRHWKSIWARLVDIIGLSGFGWEAVNKRIDVKKPIWDKYEKVTPDVKFQCFN